MPEGAQPLADLEGGTGGALFNKYKRWYLEKKATLEGKMQVCMKMVRDKEALVNSTEKVLDESSPGQAERVSKLFSWLRVLLQKNTTARIGVLNQMGWRARGRARPTQKR